MNASQNFFVVTGSKALNGNVLMHLIDLAETNDSALCVNHNTAINIKASYLCFSVAYK
jgi:hypothetical protein